MGQLTVSSRCGSDEYIFIQIVALRHLSLSLDKTSDKELYLSSNNLIVCYLIDVWMVLVLTLS